MNAAYPTEGVTLLYALLVGAQFYLALLAVIDRYPQCSRLASFLQHGLLGLAFLLLALGTTPTPLFDLATYRWALRGTYLALLVVTLGILLRFWWRMWQIWRAERTGARLDCEGCPDAG